MLPLKEIRCNEVVVRKGGIVTVCNHLLMEASIVEAEIKVKCNSCKGIVVIKAEKVKVGMRQRMPVNVAQVA